MPKITDPSLLQQLNGAQQAPAPIVIGHPNERKESREDAQLGVSQGQLGVAQGNLQVRQATLPSDVAKAQADAEKARIEADRAAAEAAKAPSLATSRAQQALKTSALLEALNTARAQIGKGWSTGNLAGTGTFQGVPGVGQNSTNLAATISGIQGSVINDTLAQLKAQSANGASGYGSLTESEAQRLAAAVGALQQTQDAESLFKNLARVEKHYRNALALSYGEDPRDPKVAEQYGIVSGDGASNDDRGGAGALTSEGKWEADPALAGVNGTVSKMIRSGRSEQEVRDYLNRIRPGMGNQAGGISEAIRYAQQYPDRPTNINLERQWVPASGVSQALGDVGMSPWGSAAIGLGDFMSAGTMDNFTNNPDLARAAMTGVQERNPWSYFGGQLAGGAVSGLTAEAMLGKMGLGAANAMRGGDILTNAAYGAGAADEPGDSRLNSALLGGVLGLGGGIGGRAASRGIGAAMTGVQDFGARALNDVGVRLTPGQTLGGIAKRTEDRLAGLPFIGDQIRARRMEGIEDFNRAAMGEAVAPIGGQAPAQIGEAGVAANQDAISNAYDAALNGRTFNADPQFSQDVADALAFGRSIPQLGEQFDAMATNRVGSLFDDQGNLTGRGFQDAVRGVREGARAARNEIMGYEFDQGAGQLEDALYGLVQRQAPDVIPAYDAANTAYRNQSVIDDAVLRGLNTGGTFMPSQLGMASRANTIKFGGKRAAARGDRPFADLQRAGQEVLPSTVPDSGTTGRLALPAAIGALAGGGGYAGSDGTTGERAGTGAGMAAVAAALASLPYSRGGGAAVQRLMMAPRPDPMVRVGDTLINRDVLAGLIAAPATALSVSDR